LVAGKTESQANDFEKALDKAKKNDKKVIVDVYTDWCGWCVKMDKETYGNKEVKKLIKENFVFVKLDAEGTGKIKYNGKEYTETDLAAYFEATGYPTTVFLEPDGKVIEYKYDNYIMKNLPGYFKTNDFIKMLEFIKDEEYKDTDLSKIL
jgi:thioredoxin-related protein